MSINFKHSTFGERLCSMLKVDFRRMLTSRLFYIIVGVCLVMPVVILVMTTMMDGTVSVDPQTGKETVIEGFDSVWQIIGTESGAAVSGSMDLVSMCNVNMLYFFIAVLVALFVSEDFRSGYAKNLFTVRAKKGDYVISKTLVCIFGGVCMILAFFAGSMLGGAVSSLPFELDEAGVGGLIMCMLAKLLLVAVFVPIYLAVSVAAKQKTWLSMVGSFAVGMLLFSMIPMLTPLDSTIVNVLGCLAGGVLFSIGLGALSNLILKKTSLI